LNTTLYTVHALTLKAGIVFLVHVFTYHKST